MDAAGGDAEYCCAVAASLFRGNALSWYCISCKHKPGTILNKFEELKNDLKMYFLGIDEAKNVRDKLKGLV